MTENKTRPTDASVRAYLNGIDDLDRRADCEILVEHMQRIVGEPPVMWGREPPSRPE
jgi:hypothetical protein